MAGNFRDWVRLNGKQLAALGTILGALQGVIASILAFGANLQRLASILPTISHIIQTGFLLCAILYLTANGFKAEATSLRDRSLSRMYRCWLAILSCWFCFYVLKSLDSFAAPVPGVLVNGWIPNAVNRAPTTVFFVMYTIACDRWQQASTRVGIFIVILFFLALTAFDAGIQQKADRLQGSSDALSQIPSLIGTPSITAAQKKLIGEKQLEITMEANRLQIISSAWDCVILMMFVSRLDSKILLLPSVLIYSLYLYAALQLVFSVADSALVTSLMAVAFIGKVVLVLTITWLFDTTGMSLFLRRVRELGDAAPAELAAANANVKPLSFRYRGSGD
jgi:hypothetical protein